MIFPFVPSYIYLLFPPLSD